MNYLIDQALAQRVLDFLIKQPYDQVHQLIPALVKLQAAPEPEPVVPPAVPPPPPELPALVPNGAAHALSDV